MYGRAKMNKAAKSREITEIDQFSSLHTSEMLMKEE